MFFVWHTYGKIGQMLIVSVALWLPPINRGVVGYGGLLGTSGPPQLFEGLFIVNIDAFSRDVII